MKLNDIQAGRFNFPAQLFESKGLSISRCQGRCVFNDIPGCGVARRSWCFLLLAEPCLQRKHDTGQLELVQGVP